MAHGLAMEGIDNGNTAVSLLLLANLTSCSGLLSPKIIDIEGHSRHVSAYSAPDTALRLHAESPGSYYLVVLPVINT